MAVLFRVVMLPEYRRQLESQVLGSMNGRYGIESRVILGQALYIFLACFHVKSNPLLYFPVLSIAVL